jgi:hypothetical protein
MGQVLGIVTRAIASHTLKPGAPLVHPECGDNVLCYNDVTIGDVDEAFAAAHAIVSQRFRTGPITPFRSNRGAELPITPDRVRAMTTQGRRFRA